MIKGLTHDVETGIINRTVKFRGKINTGYAPKEPPNTTNMSKACGFFRFMKQVLRTSKDSTGKPIQFQEWVLDQDMQKLLQDANKGSTNPRRIEAICMDRDPDDMWDSHLGKYASGEGLVCKSYGKDTVPMQVAYEGEKRVWRKRLFDGKAMCPYENCPDYKKGDCKNRGHLHVYPLIRDNRNPYQLSTTSKNSIIAIGAALEKMYRDLALVYFMKVGELDKGFRGLAGTTYTLVHKKIKSGGRDVFVTQIEFSDEHSAYVMKTIRECVQAQQKALMAATIPNVAIAIESEKRIAIESNRDASVADINEDDDAGDASTEVTSVAVDADGDVVTDTKADVDKTASGTQLDAAAAALLTGK